MVEPVLTRWTRFLPETAWNSFFFWLTWFDPYWLGGLGFDRKWWFWLETAWNSLPWSTWFDPYWPDGLGFDKKWRFWPETDWKLIFYPDGHGLTQYWPGGRGFDRKWRFWPKTAWKLIFYPGRHGLTYIDPVESVFMERCGWLEKNIFLNFKLFLNFFRFL